MKLKKKGLNRKDISMTEKIFGLLRILYNGK